VPIQSIFGLGVENNGLGAAVLKKHSAHHLWIQQLVCRAKEFSRQKRTLSARRRLVTFWRLVWACFAAAAGAAWFARLTIWPVCKNSRDSTELWQVQPFGWPDSIRKPSGYCARMIPFLLAPLTPEKIREFGHFTWVNLARFDRLRKVLKWLKPQF
jgi:hypothetical protein